MVTDHDAEKEANGVVLKSDRVCHWIFFWTGPFSTSALSQGGCGATGKEGLTRARSLHVVSTRRDTGSPTSL